MEDADKDVLESLKATVEQNLKSNPDIQSVVQGEQDARDVSKAIREDGEAKV